MATAVEIAAALCRQFEGFYRTPYLCPAGVPTIGYGATFYEDGRAVKLTDDPISKSYAEQLLLWHINNVYLPAIIRLVPALDTPERIAAFIDFTFNLGAQRLKSSTLRKRANSRDWDGVRTELPKWVRGGGKVLPGLVKRRAAEMALI